MKKVELVIPIGKNKVLHGDLHIPHEASSLVIFSHGNGSGRLSPRNRYVADRLNREKIATLLIDQLTEREDELYEMRFDTELLTERLMTVTNHVSQLNEAQGLNIG